MAQKKLLTPLLHHSISLRNKVAMAPMNRRRASLDGIPSESMITYYAQRAGAGLIITDNTLVAPNGGEVLNTPAIYNDAQIQAWRKITDAVHAKGGKIFVQLVHGGRVGHPSIQNGHPLIAPSAISVNETIHVPDGSYQPMAIPVAIKTDEVHFWVNNFKQTAVNAINAGFDGVEIHGAHGFLIDQFINPHSNHRADQYGGSIENSSRFLLEIIQNVAGAIGKDKTGVRLSPFRTLYDLKPYPEELSTHRYILDELQKLDILYVHFSSEIINGQASISMDFLKEARSRFKNLIIIAGGFTVEKAEEILQAELADLVAFGKLFISNPDLVERIDHDLPLADWDESTFYHGGDKGYIDYPVIFNEQLFL